MKTLKDIKSIAAIKAGYPATTTDFGMLGPIVSPDDYGAGWLAGNNYYLYYHAISEYLKPKRIAEIGVRRGYSLRAMALGSIVGGIPPADIKLFGIDNESYVGGSLEYCRTHFVGAMGIDFDPIRGDTRKLTVGDMADLLGHNTIDLFHVDGGHSRDETFHDLELAFHVVVCDGVILVDDVHDNPDVWLAATEFCDDRRLQPHFIPHLRGLFYIQVL